LQTRRRTGRRYAVLLFVLLALVGGWCWFWYVAAGQIGNTIDAWRAREAKAGRVYQCGTQTVGGFPFRFELECAPAAVTLYGSMPIEIKGAGALVVAQVYEPTLLISEFHGPLTIAKAGNPPSFAADWSLGQASVRGTPLAPQRASLVFDDPVLDRMDGDRRLNLLRAKRIELHGRLTEGSVLADPVIETVLRLTQASLPGLHPAAVPPIDADITMLVRGLTDFSPKPWPDRFREIQAANGRIDITRARVQQGETIAVGEGSLTINPNGTLQGEIKLTVAGLEPFLDAIGAAQMVKKSPNMDKLAGVLDRFSPGLGDAAREKVGSSIGLGLNLIGEPATLEGKRALKLPLRVDDGKVLLGPIPLGNLPALF
jgi:hypothetical protein